MTKPESTNDETTDHHTCRRRIATPGPRNRDENIDTWRIEPNGDRTCSFCGSMHFDDFEKAVDLCLEDVSKCRIEWATGKNYKLYAWRPNIRNATQGGIKFYVWHTAGVDDDRLKQVSEKVARACKISAEHRMKDSTPTTDTEA